MTPPPQYPESPAGGGYPGPARYPSPGYGAPGYPPAPGFGAPTNPQFDIGDAFSWSWNKFGSNAAALIVPLFGYAVLVSVFVGAWVLAVLGTQGPDTADSFSSPAQLVVFIVGYIAALVASMFVQAAYLSGCLDIADGKPVGIGSFFQPRNLGTALVTALLVGLLTATGGMLLVIPGLIIAFLAQFATAFVIDRSLSPFDALKASFATCRANIAGALLSWLAQLVVLLIGEMLCVVGLFVAFPLAVLIQTYTYRRLTGGWVTPVQA